MSGGLLNGVLWVGLSTTLARFIRSISMLLLAWFLDPESFGLFASLYVVIDGLRLLQNAGIGHSLIYQKDNDPASHDTAFYMSVSIALVLVAVAWSSSHLVEELMATPGIAEPFRFCALLLLIQSFLVVPARLFEKSLDFKKKFLPTAASSVAYLIIAVTLALRGHGVWALVYGEVGALTCEAATYWWLSDWRPRLRFRWNHAMEHFRFGWPVLGGILIVYLIRSVDRFVIARGAGTYELGIYAFAVAVALIPVNVFVRILNTVLYAHYAAGNSQDDRNRLFIGGSRVMAGVGILFALGLYFFAESALVFAYEDKWIDAVAPLSILALLGLFRAQVVLAGDLLVGSGKPRLFRLLNGLQLVAAVCVLALMQETQALRVSWIMTAAGLFALVISWLLASSSLNLSLGKLGRCWVGPVVAGGIAGLVWTLSENWISAQQPLSTISLILAGSALYMAIWFRLDKESSRLALRSFGRVFARSEARP